MNAIEFSLKSEAQYIATRIKEPQQLVDDASMRLLQYRVREGNDYLCPACWVLKGKRSLLDPVPTGTKDDAMGCDVCGAEFLIER